MLYKPANYDYNYFKIKTLTKQMSFTLLAAFANLYANKTPAPSELLVMDGDFCGAKAIVGMPPASLHCDSADTTW